VLTKTLYFLLYIRNKLEILFPFKNESELSLLKNSESLGTFPEDALSASSYWLEVVTC
jgi:hypothetical protein